jgi:hypothetical protein
MKITLFSFPCHYCSSNRNQGEASSMFLLFHEMEVIQFDFVRDGIYLAQSTFQRAVDIDGAV